VDVGLESSRAQPATADDKLVDKEMEKRQVDQLPPDPRYADPDDVETMLNAHKEEKTDPANNGPMQVNGSSAQERALNTSDTSESGEGRSEGERPGLGEDPLYAVPEQVTARLKARKALASAAAAHTNNPPTIPQSDIPAAVQPVLREALEAWRKAESKRETDTTLAKLNYSRAATLLTKVQVDPAVAGDQALRLSISHKRQEALTKCSEMEQLTNHRARSGYGGEGECRQCGQFRQLNPHLLCGPCHLKNKISQT
jgi:hypothetical protein